MLCNTCNHPQPSKPKATHSQLRRNDAINGEVNWLLSFTHSRDHNNRDKHLFKTVGSCNTCELSTIFVALLANNTLYRGCGTQRLTKRISTTFECLSTKQQSCLTEKPRQLFRTLGSGIKHKETQVTSASRCLKAR